ncbi:hypothetical protein [Streptomyces albus]|uniref:hypothetical protein n=1 Tax=Streptomyces albus TaxID=1888 RepID=UPI001FAC54A5|nr:hypothetical protein [Streptomyces albus]
MLASITTEAWADDDLRDAEKFQKGNFTNGEATAAAGGGSREVAYSGEGTAAPKGGGGNLSVPAGDWAPPPCWYAPTYSPKELKEKVDDSPYSLTGRLPNNGPHKQEVDGDIRYRYKEGEYKDFNLKKQGKGMFWAAVPNPAEPDAAKRESCTRLPFWVPNGERPKVENAISPKILSALAYAKVTVPDTEVELNPKARQTVNLPTWVWLDKGTYKPLSVRASVDLGGGEEIWARTTVKPASLKLSAGTEDAEVHPSSGECPVEADGGIGAPYKKGGGKRTPPCGVTYLRATQGDAAYPLEATLTWDASWEGSDGQGDDDLPDGEFGGTRNVTVREIQAIN